MFEVQQKYISIRLKFILILTSVVFFSFSIHSQESFNTTGGDVLSGNGTISYSVGQVVYTTNFANSGVVFQGVQLPCEYNLVSLGNELLNVSINIFPNPIIEDLVIDVSEFVEQRFFYTLFDIEGNLLASSIITQKNTVLITSKLAPSTYLLNVVNKNNNKVYTVKIVKY